MKIAPVMRELAAHPGLEQALLHTGQHYDEAMSKVFFEELDLPQPEINLSVGSASHAVQTATIMMKFEPVLLERKPDWILVPGDVNSTLACALVAAKLGVKVAHLEAGLRSRDRTMPEEINRILTDQLSDLLLTPSGDADENLRAEGIPADKIHCVGNVMIDTLVRLLPKARARWETLRQRHQLHRFILLTLHRPSNVDDPARLRTLLNLVEVISRECPVLFPIHPRTRARLADTPLPDTIQLTEPLGYLDFLALQEKAQLVITDSGGIQEETTYLGTPCLTLRANTERPITLTEGTNQLIADPETMLIDAARQTLAAGRPTPPHCPALWDGQASRRIREVFARLC